MALAYLPIWVVVFVVVVFLLMVLSGRAPALPDHLFRDFAAPWNRRGREPSPPASKEVGQDAPRWHLWAMRRRQRTAGGPGDESRRRLDSGSDWWRAEPASLDNKGMRQGNGAAAISGGWGNRWIKSGSRIDLIGMRRRQRPSRSRSFSSERSPAASDTEHQIAEGRSVAALSTAPMYRADLERSKTGDRDRRISVRRKCEGTQCPWASLIDSVRNRRLRSDEIRSSTSNGVYRSAEIKLSATISPPERAKGIEPIASHVLARPIIVSYAFLSVHWKFSKFLLSITTNRGSFESNRVGGATRPLAFAGCAKELRDKQPLSPRPRGRELPGQLAPGFTSRL